MSIKVFIFVCLFVCTNTDEELDGGTVSVLVKYRDIITVINKTFTICELTAAVQKSCPIEEGSHNIVVMEMFPDYAPSVSLFLAIVRLYNITFKVSGSNALGSELSLRGINVIPGHSAKN